MVVTSSHLRSVPASTRQAPTCPRVLWAARPCVRSSSTLTHHQTVPSLGPSLHSTITWTGRPPASSSPPKLTYLKVSRCLAYLRLNFAAGIGYLPPLCSPAVAQQSPAEPSSPSLPPWPPSRGYQCCSPCGGRPVPISRYQWSLSPRVE